jgi:hypothetical protein
LATGKVLTSDAFGNATWQTPGAATSWDLNGNAGTIDGTNFIGTTDNVPLNFRVNNQQAGRLDPVRNNTFLGIQTGFTSTSTPAFNNTAIGAFALQLNNDGDYNSAMGAQALYNNTTGSNNTASGYLALTNNGKGNDNTADGYLALTGNSTGNYNTGIGVAALSNNTSGEYNTALGYSTLHNNLSGSYNMVLGAWADHSITLSPFTNASAIGSNALVNASNKIRFGDATVTVVEGPVVYTVSDGRFKDNVSEEAVVGLNFIKRLRPVVYNFDTRKFTDFLTQNFPDSIKNHYLKREFTKSTSIRQSGFIAQEVEKAAAETGYDFNGVINQKTKMIITASPTANL